MRIFIDYDFPNWNEYIKAERGSLYHANAIKQAEKNYIAYTVKQRYKGKYPVTLTVRPFFKNKRKDLDNFRLKGLIDGLVAAGVLVNDNLNCINRIIVEPIYSDEVGVEVEIEETGVENGRA
jgi:Holliday junction resolvase RusA-like endonuclease